MIWSITAVIGIAALVGCASTDNGDESDANLAPTTDEATGANGTKQSTDTSATTRPAFDPKFDSADGGALTNPTTDPTPPGGNAQCIDTNDPGGAENLAKKLPDTDDCDNSAKEVSGVANGGVDVDFYSLSATDKGVSISHPLGCSLDTNFEAETAGTEMCVYARCKNSTDNAVTGCVEGTEKTSAIGMKGCCAAAPGKAIPKWDCKGITDNDSADFFISVKQTNNGEKCLPYKFKYTY